MTFITYKPGDRLPGRILVARDCCELLDTRDGERFEALDLSKCLEQLETPAEAIRAITGHGIHDVTGGVVKRTAPGEPAAEIWITTAAEPSDPNAEFTLVHSTGVPVSAQEMAQRGVELLIEARELFKKADNKRTVERIRYAISSAKGAVRIQSGRRVRKQLEDA